MKTFTMRRKNMASSSSSDVPAKIFEKFPTNESFRDHLLEAYGGDETKLAEDFGALGIMRGPDGLSVLHACAMHGLAYTVKHLIKNAGFDVNMETNRGSNALHFAVQDDHVEIVAYLIEKGANINKLHERKLTPLHMAARMGSKKSIQLLISKGADVNFNSNSCGTPLHSAITGTREDGTHHEQEGDAVRLLVENGADPNATLEGVLTPLYWAIMISSLGILKLLVEAGANPNTCVCGVSPLGHAAAANKSEMIKYLLEAGANPDHVDVCGFTPFEKAVHCAHVESAMILFRVTSPLSSFADWNLRAIAKQWICEEFRSERERLREKVVQVTKSEGDNAFMRQEYALAMAWYSEAAAACPSDASIKSNQSLCCLRSNEGSCALSYAEKCVKLRPDWAKAHYREGAAWKQLKNYPKAIEAFCRASKLDPNNKQIQKEIRSCIEEQKIYEAEMSAESKLFGL